MNFLGQYTYNIKDKKVDFPWDDYSKDLIWVILKVVSNDCAETYCEICPAKEFERGLSLRNQNAIETEIISKGNMTFDGNNMWLVPEDILNHLKTDEITFVGALHFVEILTSEDMAAYIKLFDNLEDALSNI